MEQTPIAEYAERSGISGKMEMVEAKNLADYCIQGYFKLLESAIDWIKVEPSTSSLRLTVRYALTGNREFVVNEPQLDYPDIPTATVDQVLTSAEYGDPTRFLLTLEDKTIDIRTGELEDIFTFRGNRYPIKLSDRARLCQFLNRVYGSYRVFEILGDRLYEISSKRYGLKSPEENPKKTEFLTKIEEWIKQYRVPTPSTTRPQITMVDLNTLRSSILDMNFMAKVKETLVDFYRWKIAQYQRRIADFDRELQHDQQIIKESKLTSDELKELKMVETKLARGALLVSQREATNFARMMKDLPVKSLQDRYLQILDHPTRGLESLIGEQYEPIKKRLATILYSLGTGYKIFTQTFQNIVITGPAGVGKTTLAQYLAFLFNQAGILATGLVKIVSRSDLVAEYLGQTAVKTKRLLLSSLESVIFIDEAYQVGGCPDPDNYGVESLTEIVNFLDKYIGLNIMIVAGYKKQMLNCFFPRNIGLTRRFPNIYELVPYQPADLMLMFLKGIINDLVVLYPDFNSLQNDLPKIYDIFVYLSSQDYFPNQGGDVGTLISNFYIYYYSGHGMMESLLAGAYDLGRTKGIPDDKLNEDYQKLSQKYLSS